MMGHPRSLDPPVSKNEQIDLIAGNTRVDDSDIVPTGYDDIFYIDHEPVQNGIFRGDPTIPAWQYARSITMSIPETREEVRHQGINYYDDESPTELPLGMNEVEVPDSELSDFNVSLSDKLPAFKELFYSNAASLSALNDAAEYVEAALRDGLDIDLEMDGALLSAFVPISRLDAVAAIVRNTRLSVVQQDAYIAKMTELLAEKTMDAMKIYDAGVVARRQIEMSREISHARVRAQENAPNQAPQAGSHWGVTGNRR